MNSVAANTRAAASLLLLTDGADGRVRVLMVQRAKTMKFLPDVWAFPGGAVDPADTASPLGGGDSVLGPLRAAAVRETREETGLECALPAGDANAVGAALPVCGHWVTPKEEGKRRFDTWFFLHVLPTPPPNTGGAASPWPPTATA